MIGDDESEETLFIERGYLEELGVIDIANWHDNNSRNQKTEGSKSERPTKVPEHVEELLKKMKDK